MPINSDEFNTGEAKVTLTDRILEFLSKNPDNAYTAEEIHAGVNPANQALSLDLMLMLAALAYLVFTNRIESRYIFRPGNLAAYYYRIKK
jgi:hypothetical protein